MLSAILRHDKLSLKVYPSVQWTHWPLETADTPGCGMELARGSWCGIQKLKQPVTNPPVLQLFDASRPVVISADASQHGLGVVCLQQERPVAFASQALTQTESRYAKIEKDILALVFVTRNFNDFIYDCSVMAKTGQQPLITILLKPLHTASPWLQGMKLKLHSYNLDVIYINVGKNCMLRMLYHVHICPWLNLHSLTTSWKL